MKLFLAALVALVLYLPLFVFHAIGTLDFWWWMSINITLLIALAVKIDHSLKDRIVKDFKKNISEKIFIGVVSAILLYFVFYVGNLISTYLFSFAPSQIEAVYNFKDGSSIFRISFLIAFLIGPGEEIIWRVFFQERLTNIFGRWKALLIATALYFIIHIGSMNFMLIMAALVCGFFWGILYNWKRSPVINILSHTIWDLMIFVIWPVS